MALGDWILVTTWGATLDKDVDNTIFDDKYVGLKKTSLLWSVYLSNGLVVPNFPISQAALLKRIEAAGAKAPPADLVITQDDLDDCQARPPRPPPTGLGAPVGTGTGTDRSSRARATTGTASTTPAPPPTAPGYHDVASQITYGDLIRSDRKAQTVARLEYNLGPRVATAHRTPDAPCAKMWKAILAAINEGPDGTGCHLVGLDEDDLGVVVAEHIRNSGLALAFMMGKPRVAERRRDMRRCIHMKGAMDGAWLTEAMPDAMRSEEFPRTAAFVKGETAPAQLVAGVMELATTLKVGHTSFSEAALRAVERSLAARHATADGATPQERLSNLEDALAVRRLADENAPRSESAAGGGTVGGPAQSHTKAQQDALFRLYDTANFKGQERAILRMDDAAGCLFLALTGTFLGDVGATDGPVDKAEERQALSWTPIAVFHQLIWGKVQSLQGREQMRKLVMMRIHMPKLLARLATSKLQGADEAGEERLSSLRLDALWHQLQQRSWRSSLHLAHNLLVPVLCAYHDLNAELQPRLPSPACWDPMVLRMLTPLLVGVMRICNVPTTGSTHTVRGWLAPIEQLLTLHAPAATPQQNELLARAVADYCEESLEEFVVRFNLSRYEADASAELNARLGEGEALNKLQQTLRSFNNTAARKRVTEGGADGSSIIKLPRTTYGAMGAHVAFTSPSTGAGKGVAGAMRPGTPPPPGGLSGGGDIWQASKDFYYNETDAAAALKAAGCGDRCVRAMLVSGIANDEQRERATKRACGHTWGKDGHVGHGGGGKGKHKKVVGFVPADFRCNADGTPYAAKRMGK